MEIDTLNEMFGLDLPESDDYVTIAGFILHFYQKFPKLNETVQIDKYSFKIIKVTATKIELVRMKVGICKKKDYMLMISFFSYLCALKSEIINFKK